MLRDVSGKNPSFALSKILKEARIADLGCGSGGQTLFLAEHLSGQITGFDTIPNKLGQMQAAGFIPVACFILPEDCWIDHFDAPQEEAMRLFLEKHAGDPAAEGFIANQRHEEVLYPKYKDFYGYVFYIGKKL